MLHTYKHTKISKQRLGRKYKALQGIVIEQFVFLCLSPSQKTMESILGNAFSNLLEGQNFKFFLPLSVHHDGASGFTKYFTNAMPKKSLGTALLPVFTDFCFYLQITAEIRKITKRTHRGHSFPFNNLSKCVNILVKLFSPRDITRYL